MEGSKTIHVVYVENIDLAKLRDGQFPSFYYTSIGDGKWICEKQSSQIKKLQLLRDGVRYFAWIAFTQSLRARS